MITQLNPQIPMDTPKGPGLATFLIDYGMEHDLYWVVFIDESRECWTLSNRDVRVQQNLSIGRGKFRINEKDKKVQSLIDPEKIYSHGPA
ncbi:MAG: hypothetical protein H7177_06440 [Rhizobacter sp.]|nr:hypothetical protein [Bacteriovorax sp.]